MKRTTRYRGIYKLEDDKFQVRVPKGKDPKTGRYREEIRTFRGTLQEALDFQGELRKEVKGQIQVTNNPTLNELCLRYLEHADEHLSPSTVKVYRGAFKDKVERTSLGERKAKSITTEELDRYFQALKRDRHIKGKTVNKFRSFLVSAYDQGLVWKMVSSNPVRGTTVFYNEEYDGEAVEYEVIKAVLDAYEDRDVRMGLLLELAMINQMRRSEACGLRVELADFEIELLTINRVILEPKGGGYIAKPYLKNGKRKREVDLDPRSIQILKELIGGRTDGYVFSDNDGKDPWLPGRVTLSQRRMRERICPKCFTAADTKQCDDCGVKRGVYFRVHDLRGHTTTRLIEAGLSKAAQERGGWKDETTMRKHYYKYTKKARSNAVATITEMFGKGA